jgi:hypothetical protein
MGMKVNITDARLALSSDIGRVYVFRGTTDFTPAPTSGPPIPPSPVYCVGLVPGLSQPATFGGADCADGSWGTGTVQMLHGQMEYIFGIVPDSVQRITYAGRDVPIHNNAYVIEDPVPGLPVILSNGQTSQAASLGASGTDTPPPVPPTL